MEDIKLDQSLCEIEKHIEALESRNAFQDDLIDQLNNELSVHQLQISELKSQLQLVVERMKGSETNDMGKQEPEAPPPHY